MHLSTLIRQSTHASRAVAEENAAWLQQHMSPYFFQAMADDEDALTLLAREMKHLKENRHLILTDQEKRLAEMYLARIYAELGDPAAAAVILNQRLQQYPADAAKVSPADLYGVGLLAHRTAHVAHALGDQRESASAFRRSTLLSLQAENPVSAMLNLVNWGQLLENGGDSAVSADFLELEARVSRLAGRFRAALPPLAYSRYHNDAGVLLDRLAMAAAEGAGRQALMYKALEQWDRALLVPADSGNGELRHQHSRHRLHHGPDRGPRPHRGPDDGRGAPHRPGRRGGHGGGRGG